MAEEFLTLMADFDDETQAVMSTWYEELQKAGFTGVQTPNLPFHISLASFSLDKEQEVVKEMQEIAKNFGPIHVHLSHVGIFAGGKVLFAAPDMNPCDLVPLHNAIKTQNSDRFPWTPHATILIDEAETVQKALPILLKSFHPILGIITKLHLCAFWPTREIATVELV